MAVEPYVDLSTIQSLAVGQPISSALLQQIRDNFEFFIDPPVCSVYNNAAVSVPDATLTKLNANSELFDNDAMHSTSSNTSRITFQTAGRYLVTARVAWDPNATGERLMDFLADNTTQYVCQAGAPNPSGAQNTGQSGSALVVGAVGGYVEVRVRQRSGGALNCQLLEFGAVFLTR